MFSRAHVVSSLFLCTLLITPTTHAMHNASKALQIAGIAGTITLALQTLFTVYHDHVHIPRQHAKEHEHDKAPVHVQQQALMYARVMRGKNPLKWLMYGYAKATDALTIYNGASHDMPDFFNQTSPEMYCHHLGGIFCQKDTFSNPLSSAQRLLVCSAVAHVMRGGELKHSHNYQNGSPSWFKALYKSQIKATQALHVCGDIEAINKSLTCQSLTEIPLYSGTRTALKQLQKKNPQDHTLEKLCTDHTITSATPSSWKTCYAQYLILKQSAQ